MPVEVLNTVFLVVLLLLLSKHHHMMDKSLLVFLQHSWRHSRVPEGHHPELLLFQQVKSQFFRISKVPIDGMADSFLDHSAGGDS